jgi:predicted neuraminidase
MNQRIRNQNLQFTLSNKFLIEIIFQLILFIVPGLPRGVYAQNESILSKEFIFDSVSFPQCHASTIAETPDGLAVALFGGTAERNPDVEIWFSKFVNNGWSKPVSLANGIQSPRKRYPCWNPVLFQDPGGALLLFYKVGPSPDSWWGEMKTSMDNGITWTPSKKLPPGILGPVKNKPLLLKNGMLLCPSSSEDHGWQIHFEMTKDLGNSWTKTGSISNQGKFQVIQPTLLQFTGNNIQALCRSKNGMIVSTSSNDNGYTWSNLAPTDLPNPNSGIDAVTLKDGRNLLVYNHVAVPKGKSGGPRSPLNVAISEDGTHWSAIAVLEKDEGEYSYPAIIQTRDGLIHITYTWQRKRIRHVIMDASMFKPVPMVNRQWPEY